HFQRTDLRTEALLAGLAEAGRPWFWGVNALEWDSGSLAAGTVQPASLSVIFPGSGIEMSCPGNAVCAGRLAPESLKAGETLDVWHGLAALKEGEANVTVAQDAGELAGAATRLSMLTGQPEVADVYQEGPAATVRHLRYVLQIVFGTELEDARDMSLLRVARLKRAATGLIVDETYAAPCLRLENSPVLMGCLREARDRVLVKTREMDSYKGLARRGNMGEMTTVFLILRSLARFAPRLQLMADMPVAAPWEGYLLLRELLAELSVFSTHLNPLGEDAGGRSHLEPYRHDDPAPSYRSLVSAIILLLDALSTGPRYMIRFEQGPDFQQVRLAPHIFDNPSGRNDYWISLRSEQLNLRENAASVAMAKFSPSGEIGTIIARALPGLPCTLDDQPPMGLPRRNGTIYLHLHTDSPLWGKVRMQGGISLSWEGMPDDLEAYFIVLEA
ncbi:MAG: type VI secretion system baseplate subunit TssK, partial [Desulfovibrionaceae bacterium]|nr:type VI secretion system baseplate subunit TssK [Desulfovibrionaceae bacterium]